MTKRQFFLATFILLTVISLLGVWGYFTVQQREIDARIAIETSKLEVEKATEVKALEEKENTARTKERWGWINRIVGGGE